MTSWFEVEFLLLKILRLQPSELDALEFYRAEFLLDNIKEHNDREKEHHKKEEERQQMSAPSMDMNSMMRQTNQMMSGAQSRAGLGGLSMPSMPSMPNMSSF